MVVRIGWAGVNVAFSEARGRNASTAGESCAPGRPTPRPPLPGRRSAPPRLPETLGGREVPHSSRSVPHPLLDRGRSADHHRGQGRRPQGRLQTLSLTDSGRMHCSCRPACIRWLRRTHPEGCREHGQVQAVDETAPIEIGGRVVGRIATGVWGQVLASDVAVASQDLTP